MEDRIVNTATDALIAITQVDLIWTPEIHAGDKPRLDGNLMIRYQGNVEHYAVEVMKEIRRPQLNKLIILQPFFEKLIVIALHIQPKVKEELRTLGIGYIDGAGNTYLKTEKQFLFIDGRRTTKIEDDENKNRFYTKAGAKIVYHLLQDEDLIQQPYRVIAETTETALDTVHKTLHALREMGYLVDYDDRRIMLTKKKDLLDKWIDAYDTKLKPALFAGNYRFLNEEHQLNWKKLLLHPGETYWGGEPAADLHTDFLRPEIFIMYTLETRAELMKMYRIVPDAEGPIKIYKKFWTRDEVNDKMVHPILIYADLITSGEPRNLEVAKRIYAELLESRFR